MTGDLLRTAVTRYSIRNRRRKARAVLRFKESTRAKSVLLCGALGSGLLANEAIVERAVGHDAESVVAFDVISLGPQPWPFVRADGCEMPFRDRSFDLAVSNAVIEHVGGIEAQRRFIAEHTRVARSWVITTPNRWFPIEAHTATIGLHWRSSWRNRQDSFTRLLSRREFKDLLPAEAKVTGSWWSPTFTAYYSAPSLAR